MLVPELRPSEPGPRPSSQTRRVSSRSCCTANRESSLWRWATPGEETPVYPVAGARLGAVTHTFRHIF